MLSYLFRTSGALVVACCLWQSAVAEITPGQAEQIAARFEKTALNGVFKSPQVFRSMDKATVDQDWDSEDSYYLTSTTCTFIVEKRTGVIRDFEARACFDAESKQSNIVHKEYPYHPMLPYSTIAKLATRYVADAGLKAKVEILNWYVATPHYCTTDAYVLQMQACTDGVFNGQRINMDIEPTTGMLRKFFCSHDGPVGLPKNLKPKIGIEQARKLFVKYSIERGVYSPYEEQPIRLTTMLASDDPREAEKHFTAKDREDAKQGFGILVYQASFHAAGVSEISIDAMTGKLKCYWNRGCFCIGPGLGYGLVWDVQPGPATVMAGSVILKINDASLEVVKVDKGPFMGKRVFIDHGSLNASYLYDSKSNLIWAEGFRVPIYTRANASLLKAIMQATRREKRTHDPALFASLPQ